MFLFSKGIADTHFVSITYGIGSLPSSYPAIQVPVKPEPYWEQAIQQDMLLLLPFHPVFPGKEFNVSVYVNVAQGTAQRVFADFHFGSDFEVNASRIIYADGWGLRPWARKSPFRKSI